MVLQTLIANIVGVVGGKICGHTTALPVLQCSLRMKTGQGDESVTLSINYLKVHVDLATNLL